MEEKRAGLCGCHSAGEQPETARVENCCRHKDRTEDEKKKLLRRLAIIEGQVRGIRGMLEKDCYCIDILTQVSAANSALNGFSRELLSQHIRTCVREDIRGGGDEKIDEFLNVLPKLMR